MNITLPLRTVRARNVPFDRFYLFSFAWAVANVLHALSFPDRISWEQPWAVAVVLAAALVLLAPHNTWFFLLMLGCSMANTLSWIPYTPNHILFELLVNGGILLSFGWALARSYRSGTSWSSIGASLRHNWYAAFAPMARLSLCALYFWAVFHKLNWDYFNVQISCSTYLLDGYNQRLPFLPDFPTWAHWLAVWGTLLIEAAIPVLLCLRKTRLAGILLGFGFHYFLALHPHPGLYSFSGLMFALYMLFIPAQVPAKMEALAHTVLASYRAPVLLAGRVVICVVVIGIVGLGLQGIISPGFLIWLIWGMLLATVCVLVIYRHAFVLETPARLLRVRPVALWIIPVLIFFNGLTPYLGLKTQTSFSMFSNLRVEGERSNHLFIPASVQLTSMAKDLVEIVDTNLETLQPFVLQNQLITFFELRRLTSEAAASNTDFQVKYLHHNDLQIVQVVDGESTRPEVTKPHNWLTAKLIRFRPVDKGPCLCKH